VLRTYHRYTKVQGHRLFYREAGSTDAPAVVLLHGAPASSFMFRELIPELADSYHVIAPDLLGFGFSDAPPVEEFDYTFDSLTDLTAELLAQLGVTRYAMYVQDYGAPVGWRLALRDRDAVSAIITQNGNGYLAGFVEEFWKPVWEYAKSQTPQNEAVVQSALDIDAIRWQYLHGVPEPSTVSPDTWHHDYALVHRPGNDLVQLKLFADYITNLEVYPRLHDYLRASQVPVLAVWGANDQIFAAAGARAFADDAPNAEIHLLDGGHFLLESALDEVADYVRTFLGNVLAPAAVV
jgi:pimeloyl-ACP methyl ester carboxylesterase